MAITNMTVTVVGLVGADAIAVDVDGTEATIAENGSFSADVSVPVGTLNVPVTTVDSRGRRRTRTIQFWHQDLVGGAG